VLDGKELPTHRKWTKSSLRSDDSCLLARRYSAIDREIRSLFVAAFNNNLHVTVLPNVKDMLQVKDADSVKVLVCKVLTQIGLGLETSFLILSVISQLSRARPECVRALDSYKQMSDCTK
jgi:hypothetical protein